MEEVTFSCSSFECIQSFIQMTVVMEKKCLSLQQFLIDSNQTTACFCRENVTQAFISS